MMRNRVLSLENICGTVGVIGKLKTFSKDNIPFVLECIRQQLLIFFPAIEWLHFKFHPTIARVEK